MEKQHAAVTGLILILLILALPITSAAADSKTRAYIFYRSALRMERSRRFRKAASLFHKAAAQDPTNWYYWLRLGRVTGVRLKQYRRALYYLKKSVALNRNSPHPWQEMAYPYREMKQYRSVIRVYQQALRIYSRIRKKVPARVYFSLSSYSLKTGNENLARSIDYLQRIIRGDYGTRTRDEAMRRIAMAYDRVRDFAQFRKHALQYIKSSKNLTKIARMYFQLGRALYNMRRNDRLAHSWFLKGIRCCNRALLKYGKKQHAAIYKIRAQCKYSIFRSKAAYQDFMRSYRLAPRRARCRHFYFAAEEMGHRALVRHNYRKAISYYRFVLKLSKGRFTRVNRFIRLAREHKKFRHVKPQYVHKMLRVYVTDTDVTIKIDNRRIRHKYTMYKPFLKRADLMNKVLKIFTEVISKGRMILKIDTLVHNGTVRALRYGKNKKGRINYFPDINSVSGDLYQKLLQRIDKYDTWVFISHITRLPSTAYASTGSFVFVPYILNGPPRGFFFMPWGFDHSLFVTVHEFWHVLNAIAPPLGPVHAWFPEYLANTRKVLPGWKGTTEWDFYFYHGKNTLGRYVRNRAGKHGGLRPPFKNMSFRLRYRMKYPAALVARLQKLVASVPFERQRRSNIWMLKGRKLLNRKRYRAARGCLLKALEYNRYNIKAVDKLLWVYKYLHDRKRKKACARKLVYLYPSIKNINYCCSHLIRDKQYREAIACIKRWSGFHQEFGFNHLLAGLYYKLGRSRQYLRYWALIKRHVVDQEYKTILLTAGGAYIHSDRDLPRARVYFCGHRETAIAYWFRKQEFLSWKMNVRTAGQYKISITFRCRKKYVGSRMVLSIGGKTFHFTVPAFGRFTVYTIQDRMILNRGKYKVSLKVKSGQNGVMDFKKIEMIKCKARAAVKNN